MMRTFGSKSGLPVISQGLSHKEKRSITLPFDHTTQSHSSHTYLGYWETFLLTIVKWSLDGEEPGWNLRPLEYIHIQ